jgi:hypothetical protein
VTNEIVPGVLHKLAGSIGSSPVVASILKYGSYSTYFEGSFTKVSQGPVIVISTVRTSALHVVHYVVCTEQVGWYWPP